MSTATIAPRTALFLPASNARAIEKARGLKADMVILDLEDAVRPADKDAARAAAVEAAGTFGGKLVAVRINGEGTAEHGPDMVALRSAPIDYVVLPKVERVKQATDAHSVMLKPVLAMIESPRGVLAATEIAAPAVVHGLIAGTNDLKAGLRIHGDGRAGLAMALQTIVLAARAGDAWAIDGVYNALKDPHGLAGECDQGRALGFDGKSLIHPDQIDVATRAFSPREDELEEARALIAAAQGGAERFRDRMIESMHVAQAQALLARG
ncbi:CoA ester lyase [Sphingomonas sp.]|uniref:HpcH/HpaI aldolase/citrate lyase family protein n=1 Tax=Sphingomonas sp. TaxID=28214 RepID=UPI001EB4597F|nr:CoA ester lyase [Sphingomonas sp.]MBX3593304.1 CoA ester lyase [Sphingomonas sp.]